MAILRGTTGNDTLIDPVGNDTLQGLSGDDFFFAAGDGSDFFEGGLGLDTVNYARTGASVFVDMQYTYQFNDRFVSVERIVGTQSADTLLGNNSRNTLVGNDGYDTIEGRGGADNLLGGGGNDTIAGGDGRDIIRGGDGDDRLLGENGNDLLAGGDGDDWLGFGTGLTVEDILGDAGDDTYFGGAGDDLLIGNDGADSLNGGSGIDRVAYHLTATSGVEVRLDLGEGFGGVAEGDTYHSIEWVVGSNFDDTIIGSDADELIDGQSGADSLDGGGGNDMLLLGFSFGSNDTDFTVNLTEETVTGATATIANFEGVSTQDGNDEVTGTDGANWITTFEGDDTLIGLAGDDILSPGEGVDTVDGGDGLDLVDYFDFNNDSGGNGYTRTEPVFVNLLNGTGDGGDILIDIEGAIGTNNPGGRVGGRRGEPTELLPPDRLWGDKNDNLFIGMVGNDVLRGLGGDDILIGGYDHTGVLGESFFIPAPADYGDPAVRISYPRTQHVDKLLGGAGNDMLYGQNSAQSLMSGGSGADTFVWTATENSHRFSTSYIIDDFTTGVDKIDFSHIADSVGELRDEFAMRISDDLIRGGGEDVFATTISLSSGHIQLNGVDVLSLSEDDFIF